MDQEKKKEGSDLDEFNAHRFLEKVGETKRVVELREQLKEIDLDFNKRMSLLEYLLFKYKKQVTEFLGRPQGDNSAEIAKAQKLVEEVEQALNAAISAATEAKAAAAAAATAAGKCIPT